MKKLSKSQLRYCKLAIASVFSFLLGCMVTINLVPINKTCQIDGPDRQLNIMKNSKLKSPEVILLIMSAPKNLERRVTIRQTWLKLKNHSSYIQNKPNPLFYKHYFVIGGLDLSIDSILHLSTEQSRYNDMLILPMLDSYNNLTLKVLNSFVWLNDQWDVGLNFNYAMKCDDDTFIRLDHLAHEIKQIEIMYLKADLQSISPYDNVATSYLQVNIQINKKTPLNKLQLYWGYFDGRARVKTTGKWKEDNWILCDNYLPYALGGGYILSRSLVKYVAKNANYLRQYNSEDVSVGTWLSSVDNILRIHDRRFDTEWASRGCQNIHLVSHNLSIKQMKSMYENILKTGNTCKTETVKRAYYLYEWSFPPSKCCIKKEI